MGNISESTKETCDATVDVDDDDEVVNNPRDRDLDEPVSLQCGLSSPAPLIPPDFHRNTTTTTTFSIRGSNFVDASCLWSAMKPLSVSLFANNSDTDNHGSARMCS